MKIKLRRIKTLNVNKLNPQTPDYEGFFVGNKNRDYYVLGWLKDLNSDLDLKISEVDEKFKSNKYNLRKYSKWLSSQKK